MIRLRTIAWAISSILVLAQDESPADPDVPDPRPSIVWCLENKDCTQFGDTNAICTELLECECGSALYAYPNADTKECHVSGSTTDSAVQLTFVIRWGEGNCEELTDSIKEYLIDVLEQHFETNVKVQFICGSVTVAGSVVIPLGDMSTKLDTLEEEVVQATETDAATRGVLLGAPSVSSARASTTQCEIANAVTTTYSDVTGKCYVIACDYGYEPSYDADACVQEPLTTPATSSSNDIGVEVSWIVGLIGAVVVAVALACVFLNYKKSKSYVEQKFNSPTNNNALNSTNTIDITASSSSNDMTESYNDEIIQSAPSSSDGFSEVYIT
eukprot:TRINITY_DN8819_c0_g1_i1.p1 TRINITY_DN8819_c0_g1~~TRINITY_DN8819_c0_g1_i1.p1  ORF type:complete len:351 (+),score=46.83 TRINITY_DN8819_c0_g1_i1:70-1053(+)